jgi:hypothetical protein
VGGLRDDPVRRVHRLIWRLAGVLAVAVVVGVGVIAVVVHHLEGEVNRRLGDAATCGRGADELGIFPRSVAAVPSGGSASLPIYSILVTHSTAGDAAAELVRAKLSPHPWDQEPPSTLVLRCGSGASRWLVDLFAHATLLAPHG